MCQASRCGLSMPRSGMKMRGSGPNHSGALRRALWLPLVFPIRIFDHLSMQFLRLPHSSHARPVGRRWSLSGQAIAALR